MTMAVSNQENESPHGELMRIACKGLSWAENTCQTVEKICTENNMVKNSYKYIDAVGEYLKKILVAAVNDFDDLDDDTVLFSNVSFGPDALYKSSEKEGMNGIASDGKLSPCGNGELATSSVEDLSLKQDIAINITTKSATIMRSACCNKEEKTIYTDDCSVLEDGTVTKISTFDYVEDLQEKLPNKSVLLIEEDASTDKFNTSQDRDLNCSISRETSYEGVLQGAVFAADSTDSVPLSSQSLSSISHQCVFIGERSSCQSVGVDSKPQETLCILESGESEYALKKGSERTATCVISPKCAFQKNSFSREEDYRNYSVFSTENDDINELKIEGCWDDILNQKIGDNSSQTYKRLSYKEKLKRMLLSRFWSSRDSKLVKYHGDLHSLASLDSDWELI